MANEANKILAADKDDEADEDKVDDFCVANKAKVYKADMANGANNMSVASSSLSSSLDFPAE